MITAESGLRQRKVIKRIESLRQQDSGYKVLNNLEQLLVLWKSLLTKYSKRTSKHVRARAADFALAN